MRNFASDEKAVPFRTGKPHAADRATYLVCITRREGIENLPGFRARLHEVTEFVFPCYTKFLP